MSSRRIRRVLVWQGVLIAAVVTLFGLPLGVLLGIAAWRAMAHDLGVGNTATVDIALLAVIPATLAVGLIASIIPARRARRADVGTLLRAE